MISATWGARLVPRARLPKQLQQKAWQARLHAVQQRAVQKLWQAQMTTCQYPAGAAALVTTSQCAGPCSVTRHSQMQYTETGCICEPYCESWPHTDGYAAGDTLWPLSAVANTHRGQHHTAPVRGCAQHQRTPQ